MKLTGRTICPGVIISEVFCVSEVYDIKHVQRGSILVTKCLSTELLPVFKLISGIITETGGITSHPAIVCREMKIPGLVGVTNAITLLKTGQQVKLNGSEGYLEILC